MIFGVKDDPDSFTRSPLSVAFHFHAKEVLKGEKHEGRRVISGWVYWDAPESVSRPSHCVFEPHVLQD